MFEKLRKALSREPRGDSETATPSQLAFGPLSEWAGTQGFSVSRQTGSGPIGLQGKVGGKPWRMELGRPTRNYIRNEELRARAELGINDDVSVLVMNRPLKEALEKRAYQMFTDTLQTTADPNLPEEMRWLSMFEEVGWDSLPMEFWRRYAVLSDVRDNASAWLREPLAELLMQWPKPGLPAEVPFLLLLMRGKSYLRMEYVAGELTVLQHANSIFTLGCELALENFSTDLAV